MGRSFIERSLESLREVADRSLFSESAARRAGCLQSLDPRAKLIGALALILAVLMVHDVRVVSALLVLTVSAAVIAARHAMPLVLRAWLTAVAITGIAAMPALVLTPGAAILDFPFGLTVSRQGLTSVALLLGRTLTAMTLSLLLVLTTRWADLLRALRALRVPVILIAITGMTYRYVFVLLEAAAELFEGRRSRRIGPLTPRSQRQLAGATAGALLTRTMRMTDDVYLAMQSRGYRGEVYVLDPPRMHGRDWLALIGFAIVAAAAIIVGR
jgi:cobalt/nickel transport system permease protein